MIHSTSSAPNDACLSASRSQPARQPCKVFTWNQMDGTKYLPPIWLANLWVKEDGSLKVVFRKVWAYPSMFDVSVSDLLLKCLYSFKNFFIFPGFHSFCLFVRSFYSWKIGKIAKKFFEDRFESLKNYYEKETLLLHQALLTIVCPCLIVFFLRFELPSKFVFFLSRWQTEATLDVVGHWDFNLAKWQLSITY